jgi:hypothetical protein
MARTRVHLPPEGYLLTISTQIFPSQRDQASATAQDHDHAWRQVEDPDQPLAIGMYRCDLCRVVWAL